MIQRRRINTQVDLSKPTPSPAPPKANGHRPSPPPSPYPSRPGAANWSSPGGDGGYRPSPPPSPSHRSPGLPSRPASGYSHAYSGYGSPSSPSRPPLHLGNGFASAYPAHGAVAGNSLGLNTSLSVEDERYATPGGAGKAAIEAVVAGIKDVTRVQKSWGLVWSDPELRSQVVKITLINLLSLTLLSLFPLVLSPLFARDANHDLEAVAATTNEVRGWFNALLSWPLFAVCFWVNAIWGPGIAKRAQGMMHPSHRHQPFHTTTAPAAPSTVDRVWLTLTRLLLIADFTLVARTLRLVPYVGRLLSTSYVCLINAYYAYEWMFASRQWSLDYRAHYISSRGWYMFGFGLPATVVTSFGPPLINMAIFSLIYPFFVIQALQSRPPTTSVVATTPTSGPSTPTREYALPSMSSPVLGHTRASSAMSTASGYTTPHAVYLASSIQIPIFFFARHALKALRWLSDAAARQRGGVIGGRERLGKRGY